MKRALVSVRKWNGHPRYSYVCHFRQGDKRHTRYFVHKKDATVFAGEKQVELLNQGRKHGELSEEERRAVIETREIAEGMEKEGFGDFSLRAAIEHYARYLRTLRTSKTVERASEEFLEVREAEERSATHLADLRHRVEPVQTCLSRANRCWDHPARGRVLGTGAEMQFANEGELSAGGSQSFRVLCKTQLRAVESASRCCPH